MGWFDRFRKIPQAEQYKSTGPPNPEFLGDFLVYSILETRFGLKEQQLDEWIAKLPDAMRDLVKSWTLIYASWLFRLYAVHVHGKDFGGSMMAQTFTMLKKTETISDGMAGMAKCLEYWYDNLDNSTSSMGKKVNDIEIPFEVWAALSFMALDPESPYYMKKEDFHSDQIEFDIAEVLVNVRDATKSLIEFAVKTGAPVQKA